jgi:hypothetical protein
MPGLCDIVHEMATTVTIPQHAPGIVLKTVISELQFILELSQDNPSDPRLPKLLSDAKDDLATATKKVIGDDPIIIKDPGVQQ